MLPRRPGPSVLVLLAVVVLVVGPATVAAPVALAGVGSARAAPGPRFRWPLDGTPAVVRPFDPPAKPWLPGHRGVDLTAEPGASVRAAGAGVVLFAGLVAGRGVVSVVHAGGLRTTYEPVAPAVHTGERVEVGDLIGRLGAGHPGCGSFTACLHWGLRRGDAYLDPLALLGRARVRLLPTGPAITGRAGPGSAGPRRASRTRRRGCRPSGSAPRKPAMCRAGVGYPVGQALCEEAHRVRVGLVMQPLLGPLDGGSEPPRTSRG